VIVCFMDVANWNQLFYQISILQKLKICLIYFMDVVNYNQLIYQVLILN
jgi:hypothetical protein